MVQVEKQKHSAVPHISPLASCKTVYQARWRTDATVDRRTPEVHQHIAGRAEDRVEEPEQEFNHLVREWPERVI